MIDIRKLKELVRLMVTHDLTEVDLRDSEEQVTLRRPSPLQANAAPHVHVPPATSHPSAPSSPTASTSRATGAEATASTEAARAAAADETGLVAIQSPMVGTFYATPDPDSPAFVSVGDTVNPDTVVCLIEAMKIFNEIKAETQGRIERVLVKNGEAVEFGQRLFLVRND